jgi:raffinose/stachyose/melibiose transport system substrate-binding protein
MYCNNCGKEVKTGARFCNHCGAATDINAVGAVESAPAVRHRPRKHLLFIAIAVALLVVIGVGAAAFLFGRGSSSSSNSGQTSEAEPRPSRTPTPTPSPTSMPSPTPLPIQPTPETPSSSSGDYSTYISGDEQITLRVLNYIDLSYPGAMEELAFIWDAFERDHPNITIYREDEYNESYHRKIEMYAAQNALPDVIYCWPSGRDAILHENKLFKDLTPLVQRDGLNMIFGEAYLDPAAQAGGYLAMLPRFGIATHTFWVNHEVLDAVGLQPAKTYSELKNQVRVLAASGYETVMMPNAATWVMQSCLFSLVAGRFMGEGWEQRILRGETDFTDPKFVEALEFIQDMYNSGVLAQSSLALDYGDAPGFFANTQAAYYIDGDWRTSDFITNSFYGGTRIEPVRQNNFDIMVFPDIDTPWNVAINRSNSIVLSAGWGISSALADGSPELEAAWTLLKWLSSKEVHEFLLDSGTIYSSSRNDIDYSRLDFEPLQVKTATLSQYYDKATVVIDDVFDGAVYAPLNDYLHELGLGTMTPRQIAQNTQRNFEDWKTKQ